MKLFISDEILFSYKICISAIEDIILKFINNFLIINVKGVNTKS